MKYYKNNNYEQEKNNYRSYVLLLKNDKETIEIDFGKVKQFEELGLKKYKLCDIDKFTTSFKSEEGLLIKLITEDIITVKQSNNAKLFVYPVKRNKVKKFINGKIKNVDENEYAKEPLENGVAFSRFKDYFEKDNYVLQYLIDNMDNMEFIDALYKKYAVYGEYNKSRIEYARMNAINENAKSVEILQTMNSLLESIRNYCISINNNDYIDSRIKKRAENNILEFYQREKYYVTSCTEGYYGDLLFTYKKNKDGSRTTSYPKLRNLIMFIISYIEEKELKEELEKQKILELKYQGEQVSLWDLEYFKK